MGVIFLESWKAGKLEFKFKHGNHGNVTIQSKLMTPQPKGQALILGKACLMQSVPGQAEGVLCPDATGRLSAFGIGIAH